MGADHFFCLMSTAESIALRTRLLSCLFMNKSENDHELLVTFQAASVVRGWGLQKAETTQPHPSHTRWSSFFPLSLFSPVGVSLQSQGWCFSLPLPHSWPLLHTPTSLTAPSSPKYFKKQVYLQSHLQGETLLPSRQSRLEALPKRPSS